MKKILSLFYLLCFILLLISCSNVEKNLNNAAKTGNIIEIKKNLDSGADINSKTGKFQNTALHEAAITGNLNTVKFLLENNADINVQNKDNNTPLHLAIQNNKKLVVNYLIEKDANLNVKGEYGNSALHQVIIYGDDDTFNKILEKKPDLDIQNDMGYSPIFLAYGLSELASVESKKIKPLVEVKQNKKYLEELLIKGADLNIKDINGNTILHHSVKDNDIKMVKFIIAFKPDINILNNLEGTPLHIAVRNRYDNIAKLLLESGANRTIKNNLGALPSPNVDINYAVKNNDVETARLYFNLGGTNEVYNSDSLTPLHKAAMEGYYEIAKIIVEAKVDLNVKDRNKYEEPPLFWAIAYDHIDIVKLLIDNGANVNERAKDNSIALMLTAGLGKSSINATHKGVGQVEIAKLLIANGSELDVKNSEGKTALEYAYEKECFGVAKLIEEKSGISSNINFVYKAITDKKPNLIKMIKSDFITSIEFVQSDYDNARRPNYSIEVSAGISPMEYYKMGENYYNTGRFQEAALLFQKSVEAERRKSYPNNEMLGSLLSWTGAAYFEYRQYNESLMFYKYAIAVLSKVSNYSDSYGHVLFRIGQNLYAMQRWSEAVPYFEMTISEYIKEGKKGNINYTLDFYIYLIDYKQGKYKEAIEFYKAAIKLSDDLGDSSKKKFFQGQLDKIK